VACCVYEYSTIAVTGSSSSSSHVYEYSTYTVVYCCVYEYSTNCCPPVVGSHVYEYSMYAYNERTNVRAFVSSFERSNVR
jgi:hypothetical protein